jgi:hypothetical protein
MQYLEIQSAKKFDPETSKRFEACKENNYPICLEGALHDTYGEGWRRKTIVEDDRVVTSFETTSPKRMWKVYVRSVSECEKNLGADVTREIETKAMRRMESMQCQKCPMYEFELRRLGSTADISVIHPQNGKIM